MEIFSDGLEGACPASSDEAPHPIADTAGGYLYQAAVSSARPPADYTARIVPLGGDVAIPLEDARVVWKS